MSAPSPSPTTAAVDRAAALLASDPAAAEREASAVLSAAPRDPRAALIVASARRRLGDPTAALALLSPLAKAFPRAAHTHYELGAARAALGDDAGAIVALRHAGELNRDLAEAWRALGDALFRTGDAQGAERAFQAHARACVAEPYLKPAAEALFHGDLAAAEADLRRRLEGHPLDAAALHLLARVHLQRERHPEAEAALAQCLALEPDRDGARFDHANALFQQQKGAQALAGVEGLLVQRPRDGACRNLAAACLALIGDHDRAIGLYEDLLAEFERQPKIWLNYGHALRTVGRADEAAGAYRRCLALDPGLGDAYWSLANLKVAAFSPDDIAAMRAALAQPNARAEDRLHLYYALGKALEDGGDDAGAMENYSAGAIIRRAASPYDPQAMTDRIGAMSALFTRDFFAARREGGATSSAPIFVVGLPRSGSTLVEQILASHSAVEGTMELPDISLIAAELDSAPGGYLAALAGLDADARTALGERYLDQTRVHRRLGRPMFVDKMPNNFQHVGLIRLILPNARIVDARRHPLGACFSGFKQHFAQGQAFSYDLGDLGRFYRDYATLTSHFDTVLPGLVHRVIYEDMVQDTEAEVRRLLSACGLAFEPACLRFHETRRAVKTVSSEQVRRPIFRDGLERWRRFEPWLGPVKDGLGDALQTWRG